MVKKGNTKQNLSGVVVKRGGTKRKIPLDQKILNKQKLAVSYTKRKEGLFSKASQLCLLTGSQIAILATPPSAESSVSFYSFGHSSVDAVVSAYLSGQPLAPVSSEELKKQMREDVAICMAQKSLGLGFWWDDKKLESSKDVNELLHALDSMCKLVTNLDVLCPVDNQINKEILLVPQEPIHQNLLTEQHFDQTLDQDQQLVIDEELKNNDKHGEGIDQTLILDQIGECLLTTEQHFDHQTLDQNLDQQLVEFGNDLECLLSSDDFDHTEEEHFDQNQTLDVGESSSAAQNMDQQEMDFDFDFDHLIRYDTSLELESLFSDGLFKSLENLEEFKSSFLFDDNL